MNSQYFFAQDLAGNAHKVLVNRHHHAHADATHAVPEYLLDDGSAVRRIDDDTFEVAATGALITLVRD